MINFFACIYSFKFACSFSTNELSSALLDLSPENLLCDIRKRTWHQTVYLNNTLPSLAAILLHSKRLGYIICSCAHATVAFHVLPDPTRSGWIIVVSNGDQKLIPEWDSAKNRKEIGDIRKVLLKKCRCEKNYCANKRCSCKKAGNICTTLCSCVACKNLEASIKATLQSILITMRTIVTPVVQEMKGRTT